MNLKYTKVIFILIIIILILVSVYMIYMKDSKAIAEGGNNSKETIITKDIIIGITTFDTINPLLTKSLELQHITKLIYEPLINITQDFDLEPAIAKEWSKIDERIYLVKIDGDKKFSNRNRVKIEDIEFTINKIKEEDSIYNENVENIEKIEKIDESTFKIYLKEKQAFFEYLLCFPIVEKTTYNIQKPYGTGEYRINNIEDKQIEIVNEERKISIKIYEDIAELYNNFSRGNVDYILTQNINYEEYIGNIGFNETLITAREFYYISCAGIKNIEVRNEIAKNINKEKIVYDLYNNKYKVAKSPLDYGSYLNIEENKTNIINTKLKNIITISSSEENKKIAEAIKNQLEEKGIKLQNYINTNANLILKKQVVPIVPDISIYFEDEESKKEIQTINEIENKEILKQKYKEILEEYYKQQPFISLFFNNYIILTNENLKGDFSGNWYNIFYNVDTWYKNLL